MLKDNLALIQERIKKAVSRRNAAPENIILVAVTKTVAPRVMNEAWELGINNFGENRVQDALPKIGLLRLILTGILLAICKPTRSGRFFPFLNLFIRWIV